MGSLRVEVSVVTGVEGMKPKECLSVRLEFDKAFFVASIPFEPTTITFHGPLDMPSDIETTAQVLLRPTALRHADIRLQNV